jgi:serine kinase of HPr protein (carbohydrate metabolism regulator)
MTRGESATIHASAVKVGERAVLIRGPSGSGKSRLALELILAGRAGVIAKAELIGDDRVYLSAEAGALMVRPAENLAGLLEVRGLGIRRLPYANEAAVSLVVDLDAEDAARLPEARSLEIVLDGVKCRRIPIGKGFAALPVVTAMLLTSPLTVL